jgi:acetoin utilization protein AcuB
MREHAIRHLPVLEGGKLVGIVSQRDVHVFDRVYGDVASTVEDAMTVDVLVAHGDDPVDSIAEQMAERRYGSAVVVGPANDVVGIFTTVDGMRVLADVLRRATA